MPGTIVEYHNACKKVAGFTHETEYQEIMFNVSATLVVADLSPLAFLQMAESIGEGGEEGAICRLHQRLAPLLSCRHQWSALRAGADRQIDRIIEAMQSPGSTLYTCKSCTAHVLRQATEPLPIIGRWRCS
jgi:hypothetical protein